MTGSLRRTMIRANNNDNTNVFAVSRRVVLSIIVLASICSHSLWKAHCFTVPYHNPHHFSSTRLSSSTTSRDDTTTTTTTSTTTTTTTTTTMTDIGYTLIRKELYDIVQVDLENDRDYPIYIGTNYSDAETSSLLLSHIRGQKVLIVTNDQIAPLGYLEYYTQLIQKADPTKLVYTYIIPDGEQHKNMNILSSILDQCMKYQLDRKSTLIALGGGVVGDMIGFAAAIYVRGISFVQIPTTVMAMVDSSVGGKTGINHPDGKNMIGSFHQPSCVYVDTQTLATLPDREYCSGISEMIKYGLIRDYPFFVWLEDHMDELVQRHPAAIREAVTRSCQNKATVVKLDEKESIDIRATLNLGHTFGHAIETGCGYGTYLHGEAVSIGIVMAAKLSHYMNWITKNDYLRIVSLLERAQLPIMLRDDTIMTRQLFYDIMSVDKKVTNGQIRFVLLQGDTIGNCVVTSQYDPIQLDRVINEFVQHISPYEITMTDPSPEIK